MGLGGGPPILRRGKEGLSLWSTNRNSSNADFFFFQVLNARLIDQHNHSEATTGILANPN